MFPAGEGGNGFQKKQAQEYQNYLRLQGIPFFNLESPLFADAKQTVAEKVGFFAIPIDKQGRRDQINVLLGGHIVPMPECVVGMDLPPLVSSLESHIHYILWFFIGEWPSKRKGGPEGSPVSVAPCKRYYLPGQLKISFSAIPNSRE